ncbi:hypothetical protein QBC40DRAFT_179806 [Triangularia verruculosa]|uniref:Macro domain-containing protein n=1 Tax=Triangularia verruculosa TaxID=2587418 RepID=A0AAN7AUJ0_9PEZI|nr:hypothetical protein QBC40DRAFT_179806 [Triangularia verruculosa]
MAILKAADIPSVSLLYKLHKLSAAPADTKLVSTLLGPTQIPPPSKALNDRVAVYRADITCLAVDAIVNAANRFLLGGGGVDGAIHRAAGDKLYEECRKLNGCDTGSAKITDAYDLPCKRVIHAVGPIYDPFKHDESEKLLVGCYTKSLELAVENQCRTIAFSALSTGVYGYPSREAAPAALSAIRHFLTGKDGDKIDKVILVTFEKKDVDAYTEFVPHYFPPVPEGETSGAAAQELPSAPTSDPVDV